MDPQTMTRPDRRTTWFRVRIAIMVRPRSRLAGDSGGIDAPGERAALCPGLSAQVQWPSSGHNSSLKATVRDVENDEILEAQRILCEMNADGSFELDIIESDG